MSKKETVEIPGPAEQRAHVLIARLGRTAPTYREFHWPGGKLAARIRVATGERQIALAAAVDRFAELELVSRKDGKIDASALVGDDFAEEQVLQLLARVIEDPERPIPNDPLGRCYPLFESADELRDLTTEAERGALWAQYRDIVSNNDPDGFDLTEVEAMEIIRVLKKKDAIRLRAFDASTLRRFLLSMADQLLSSPPGKYESSPNPFESS